MAEQRDNSGALFKNDRKLTADHPDYTGSGRVGGVDVWLSGWLKTSQKGQQFMSLAFKPKVEPKVEPAKKAEPTEAPWGEEPPPPENPFF